MASEHHLQSTPYRSPAEVRRHFSKLKKSGVTELSLVYPVDSAELFLEILQEAKKSGISIVALHTGQAGFFRSASPLFPLDLLYRPNDPLFLHWIPLRCIVLDSHLDDVTQYEEMLACIRTHAQSILQLGSAYCVTFKALLDFSQVDGSLLGELVQSLVDHGFTEINLKYTFPSPQHIDVDSTRNHLAAFCRHPIAQHPALRFEQLPFCFLPASFFRALYRTTYDRIQRQAFFQRQRLLIQDIREAENQYHRPCLKCRRRAACYAITAIADHAEYRPYLFPNTELTIAFVGASLAPEDVKELSAEDIVFTAPAQQADAFMAILEGFKNILLLDGYFFQRYALTTFELLIALLENINVFGASSLGALRGLELSRYGMRAGGYVYRFLRSHKLVPYHVVAQAYDDENQPVTEALITICRFLELAQAENVISGRIRKRCYRIAEALHFSQLTYQRLFEEWGKSDQIPSGVVQRLQTFLSDAGTSRFDVKRQDALSLLRSFRNQIRRDGPDRTIRTLNGARDKYMMRLRSKYRDHYDSSLAPDWKKSTKGGLASRRERPLSRTIALAEQFFSDLDVVVSDTSLLDETHYFMINVVFIPFFFLDYGNSAGSGYGESREQALVSAYGEVLERIPAGTLRTKFVDCDEVKAPKYPFLKLPFYLSMSLESLRYFLDSEGQLLDRDYIECTDIITGKKAALPKYGARLPSSSGMATGNTMVEAVLYGLYEVIEHDIYAVWETVALFNELQHVNLDPADIQDEPFQMLIKDLAARGHQAHFFNLINRYDIPMVLSIFYEADRQLVFSGIACRLDLQDAVIHSFHEALNGHFVTYFGSRDDRWGFEQQNASPPLSFLENFVAQPKKFKHEADACLPLLQQLDEVLKRLQQKGTEHVFAIDLSPLNEYKLSVVKILVPGMDRRRAARRTTDYYRKCLETRRLVTRLVSGVEPGPIDEEVYTSKWLRQEFSIPLQRFFKA